MKKYFYHVLMPLGLLFSQATVAQNNLFKAGVVGGLNLTQVDGDEQFGYDKWAYNFGLRGGIIFSPVFELGTELLYSQKGTVPTNDVSSTRTRRIAVNLHYAEVPILAKFSFKKHDNGYYKWGIHIGGSYSRLLKSNTAVYNRANFIDTSQVSRLSQNGYKSSDFSFIIGISHYFNRRLALNVRHTVSLTPFYVNPNPQPIRPSNNQRDYYNFRTFFFTAAISYDFISPKVLKVKKKVKKPVIKDDDDDD